MALNTPALKQTLKDAFIAVKQDDQATPEQQLDALCQAIATSIEVFVKSGDVTVTVQTTGTATAQSGTGTGKVQ